jgi:hypothetical protein
MKDARQWRAQVDHVVFAVGQVVQFDVQVAVVTSVDRCACTPTPYLVWKRQSVEDSTRSFPQDGCGAKSFQGVGLGGWGSWE